MIEKTVGAAGDYTTWADVWDSLGTLADNYTFTQIDDVVETTNSSNTPNLNGYSVVFDGNGYKISVHNVTNTSRLNFRYGTSLYVSGHYINNFIVESIYASTVTMLQVGPNSLSETNIYTYIDKLKLKGYTGSAHIGLISAGNGTRIYLTNSIIYNCTSGISCFTSGGTSTDRTGYRIAENCAIYGCGTGITGSSTNGNEWEFKNCVISNCSVKCVSTGDEQTYTNCADSDNSISISTATYTNCITGITDSDFTSVTYTDTNFLEISETSKLYGAGSRSISSWNIEDIDGNARPSQITSVVSIGIYEPLYYGNYMQFVSTYNTVTVRRPDFGYKIDIHMPIYIAEKHPHGYTTFDCDSTKASDYRVLNTSNWLTTESEKYLLNEFFKQAEIGRCENIIMRLGQSSTGFYPFGPDLGDVGDFTVRLLEQKQSNSTYNPKTYFRDEISFVLVSAPGGYSLPAEMSEGPFQIGNISGLMPPQMDTNPDSIYNYANMLSRTGAPYSMDGRTNSDSYETTIEQWCNQGKAAALINDIITNIRDNDINIIAGDNYYLFGMDNGSSGTYTCLFLGSNHSKNEVILSMTHERFNRWIVPMNFWLKSIAAESTGGIIEITDDGIYEDSTSGVISA